MIVKEKSLIMLTKNSICCGNQMKNFSSFFFLLKIVKIELKMTCQSFFGL